MGTLKVNTTDRLLVAPNQHLIVNYKPVTSYANPGGSGDRRTSLIICWDVTNNSQFDEFNALFDGSLANATFWPTSSAAAQFIVDFSPLGFKQIIDEFKWYQDTTPTHGTWQMAGSDDGLSWTNIGSTFTLGGSTVQTVSVSNTTEYRMYRWQKTSGSTSNGPFLREMEFKIAAGPTPLVQPLWLTNITGRITCTGAATGGLFQAGVAANLVNGNITENTTFFNSNKTDASLKFDFGVPVIVVEARWYQDTGASHGTWKWAGSPDDITYTDLTVIPQIFAANSSSPKTQRGFAGNTTAYRYYKSSQTSGLTTNGPFTREMEFRIIPDGMVGDVGVSLAATLSHAATVHNLPASPALGVSLAATISHINSHHQPVICVVT